MNIFKDKYGFNRLWVDITITLVCGGVAMSLVLWLGGFEK